ncbi:MAG: Imm1 family immunity protein [Propionibacteriaceae bacterium]
MPDYHLTWPDRELVLTEVADVVARLIDLDQQYAAAQRSVLVGIDTEEGSIDVGLGVLHVAMMVTTSEDPGYIALGAATSDEEVTLEFDGEPTAFPVSCVLTRDTAFTVVNAFLAGDERPSLVEWAEF